MPRGIAGEGIGEDCTDAAVAFNAAIFAVEMVEGFFFPLFGAFVESISGSDPVDAFDLCNDGLYRPVASIIVY